MDWLSAILNFAFMPVAIPHLPLLVVVIIAAEMLLPLFKKIRSH
jgi:hypothetical protein